MEFPTSDIVNLLISPFSVTLQPRGPVILTPSYPIPHHIHRGILSRYCCILYIFRNIIMVDIHIGIAIITIIVCCLFILLIQVITK